MEQVTAAHTGGSGTPLLLLHGVNASWSVWRPVLPALEAHHSVMAPTLPGHRGGPELAGDASTVIGALADGLEKYLDDAGIDRTHIAGNSLGGWLALEMAQRGRALSVVAFSPAGAWRRPKDLSRLVRLFKVGGKMVSLKITPKLLARPKLRKAILRSAFERGDLISNEEIQGFVADMGDCAALPLLLAEIQSPDGGLHKLAIGADVPVRIAWPVKDRTIPFANYGQPIMDLLPNAELVTLPGVGHVPMWDAPDLVARTILDFIDRAEPAATPETPVADT